MQKLFQWLLETSGFEVIGIANDGVEAVDLFRSFSVKPEIIIMDHRMPNKSGLDATKEILDMSSKPKIIFASADNSVKDEALALGAASFLSKPFDYQVLIQEMKALLNI